MAIFLFLKNLIVFFLFINGLLLFSAIFKEPVKKIVLVTESTLLCLFSFAKEFILSEITISPLYVVYV